jgi:hypothetical protein
MLEEEGTKVFASGIDQVESTSPAYFICLGMYYYLPSDLGKLNNLVLDPNITELYF